MARTSKTRAGREVSRRRTAGGTLVGLLAGLVIGVAIAVAVALLVAKAPVPFVNKVQRSGERIIDPAITGTGIPDPNRGLQSRARQSASEGAMQSASIPATSGNQTPGQISGQGPDSRTVDPRSVPPAPVAGDMSPYMLQAGAFKGQEDADSMKGRLALIGYEAQIVTAEVNGKTFYRVRVGPYARLDDMNVARSRLAENGIEASVVRQR